ncbi:MAG: antibiotic biosynthesis monooxygenase [Planctomycetota bacterium]|nr:antibiotic biosynthesis monooxygenase [Planctomycetota bacterium]
MYIAMNRFRIAAGREDEFERLWHERKSYLDQVPGFRSFRLLRGSPAGGESIFISHSSWDSEGAFEAWTESEEFTKAHRRAKSPEGVVLSHPEFEGYDVVMGE